MVSDRYVKKYELTYEQPHEYDDDSPSGIGDHGISYWRQKKVFEANTDEAAKQFAQEHCKEGGLQFGFHIGSPTPGLYPRRFISLCEVINPREVPMTLEDVR